MGLVPLCRLTQQGRQELANNAKANKLSDQVLILEGADDTALDQIAEFRFQPETGLVFCDIEGAEFDVLTPKFLEDFKGATMVVELHDRLMPEGLTLRKELIARLPESAKHSILLGQPTDWRGIPDIEAMSDNDRALICSDGRKVRGEWLIVTY